MLRVRYFERGLAVHCRGRGEATKEMGIEGPNTKQTKCQARSAPTRNIGFRIADLGDCIMARTGIKYELSGTSILLGRSTHYLKSVWDRICPPASAGSSQAPTFDLLIEG
jgi:hypothetical protein